MKISTRPHHRRLRGSRRMAPATESVILHANRPGSGKSALSELTPPPRMSLKERSRLGKSIRAGLIDINSATSDSYAGIFWKDEIARAAREQSERVAAEARDFCLNTTPPPPRRPPVLQPSAGTRGGCAIVAFAYGIGLVAPLGLLILFTLLDAR